MCGRLRVGKDFLHLCRLVGAPMCSACCAVHMTAGHNALRRWVPINIPHSTILGDSWVVLIAGWTGSALRAVRPPNFTSRQVSGAISLCRKRGDPVTLALGHRGPGHSCELVGERDGSDLVGLRANNAVPRADAWCWILA